MNIEAVNAKTVRDALRAVRYAKPLQSNPLLEMAALGRRLREAGLPDTPQTREWEIGHLLDSVSQDALTRERAGLEGAMPRT